MSLARAKQRVFGTGVTCNEICLCTLRIEAQSLDDILQSRNLSRGIFRVSQAVTVETGFQNIMFFAFLFP